MSDSLPQAGRNAPAEYSQLLELFDQISMLTMANTLLMWDQWRVVPPAGAAVRGRSASFLAQLMHERMSSQEFGALLDRLAGYEADMPYGSDEASMVRVARTKFARYSKVRMDLANEQRRAGIDGYEAWARARQEDNYALFAPALQRIVDASLSVAESLGYSETPMDALLQDKEPGLTTRECTRIFGELRPVLIGLTRAIQQVSDATDDEVLRQHFPADALLACGREAVQAILYDDRRRGRIDLTLHPYQGAVSQDDVRITTDEVEMDFCRSFFHLMHEAGHAIQAQGLPAHLKGTALGSCPSMGISESQSRLWENIVGRSLEFWYFFLPTAQRYFPEQLRAATPESMCRAVNRVCPSLIRVGSDELTYNLHNMLRFELEVDVLSGRLAVVDLRDAWNALSEKYLGLTPRSDSEGVLQDVNWATYGAFGGQFQGFTLGNIMSAQFFEAARRKHPGLLGQIAEGNFRNLFDWLRDNVCMHGAKYAPEELLIRSTGQGLSSEPYIRYLTRKYAGIYGVDVSEAGTI